MIAERVLASSKFIQPSDDEPVRSVVKETSNAVIVAWHVKPGQRIKAHRHPEGQDTWTILSGSGYYCLDLECETQEITAGDIVIAQANEVHGVENLGDVPLVFISVVSPAEAGYELLEH